MTKKIQHSDENPDLRISPKLSVDLRALFEPQHPVPPEVDRAVFDEIHRHFVIEKPAEGKRRRFRWAALWKVAAAVAVVIFAFSLDLTKKPDPKTNRRATPARFQTNDIDLNGRVDILDAFTLARQIEQVSHIKSEWDINNDGQVDRSDVDTVALAAVRLDKGVL
jgi:hypothetical protein